MNPTGKPSRRRQILETLAAELESRPGSRITTAALAKATGVSEAALYRHFASKAEMFEALIDFAEETVFGLINKILEQERAADNRCERIVQLVLGFSERNPGSSPFISHIPSGIEGCHPVLLNIPVSLEEIQSGHRG